MIHFIIEGMYVLLEHTYSILCAAYVGTAHTRGTYTGCMCKQHMHGNIVSLTGLFDK